MPSRVTGDNANAASTRTSRIIRAPAEALYQAFMDPAALVEWLPPGEMTGEIHAFDARVAAPPRKPKLTEPPRFSSRLQPVESITDPEWQQQNQNQHRDAHEDTPNLLKR